MNVHTLMSVALIKLVLFPDAEVHLHSRHISNVQPCVLISAQSERFPFL